MSIFMNLPECVVNCVFYVVYAIMTVVEYVALTVFVVSTVTWIIPGITPDFLTLVLAFVYVYHWRVTSRYIHS